MKYGMDVKGSMIDSIVPNEPPGDNIVKLMEDVFAGRSPILRWKRPISSIGGTKLEVVQSDQAKRLLSFGILFGVQVAVASMDPEVAINPVFARSAALSQIFGYLGWMMVATENPKVYLGKRLKIDTDWAVSTMPDFLDDGPLTLEDYAPTPGSIAAGLVESLAAIFSGNGSSLNLRPMDLSPVKPGDEVVGEIADPRLGYVMSLTCSVMEESETFNIAYGPRNRLYRRHLECMADLQDRIVLDVFPQLSADRWVVRTGQKIVIPQRETPCRIITPD